MSIDRQPPRGSPPTMEQVEWLGNSLIGSSLSYCMFHAAEDMEAYVQTHAALIANAFIDAVQTDKEVKP